MYITKRNIIYFLEFYVFLSVLIDGATSLYQCFEITNIDEYPSLITYREFKRSHNNCRYDGDYYCMNKYNAYKRENQNTYINTTCFFNSSATSISTTSCSTRCFRTLTLKSTPTTISASSLVDFQSTSKIYIENGNVIIIEPGAFNSLHDLKEVYLSGNNFTNIQTGVLNSLLNLQILDLSKNRLYEIRNESLRGIIHLQHLNLSSNLLTEIDSSGIAMNDNLKYLDLSFNRLVKFNFDILPKSLVLLNVSNNQINDFCGCFGGIQKVNLGWNKLTSLDGFKCSNQDFETRELDLSYNLFGSLPTEMFRSFSQLEILNLQGNQLLYIPHSCFFNLVSLRHLNLSRNKIENLQYGLFDNLEELEILDVSHNKLAGFERHQFYAVRKIKSLFIQFNQMVALDVDYLESYLKDLQEICLENNRFTCDELVKIVSKLKYDMGVAVIVNKKTGNSSNIQGMACSVDRVEQQTKIPSVSNEEDKIFNEDFEKSAMNKFFNEDFSNSSFFKYLNLMKTLQVNDTDTVTLTKKDLYDLVNNKTSKYFDIKDTTMYNYFEKDFLNSTFYRYLESLKNSKYQENDVEAAKFVSRKENEEKSSIYGLFVTVIVLLVITIFAILLNVCVKVRKNKGHEQVELLAA